MMKNNLRFLLLFVVFGLSGVVYGQRRPCAVPSVPLVPTVHHATCFNPTGSIDFKIKAPSRAFVKELMLLDEDETVVYQTNEEFSGSITGLPIGMYHFSGSVVVEYKCDGLMYMKLVKIDQYVWLGIETVWTEKVDMVSSPNSYSAKRNATTTTYGGVRSSNGISSGDGWIEMSAVFGSTTNNRVYLLIGETNPLGVFDPSAAGLQHIEFHKGSGGNGIRIRYINSGNVWIGGISSDPNDKVRLVRTGTTLTIQLNDDPTTVFTFPQAYSGPMNIAVRTLAIGDGCLDVVSSFGCVEQPESTVDYAELRRKVDGGYTLAVGGMLKFTYDEEYAIDTGYLPFNIYDKQRTVVASSDLQGAVTGIASPLVYQEDDTRYTIDLTAITGVIVGEFYTLEVIDTKGNKKYLKFFYKN